MPLMQASDTSAVSRHRRRRCRTSSTLATCCYAILLLCDGGTKLSPLPVAKSFQYDDNTKRLVPSYQRRSVLKIRGGGESDSDGIDLETSSQLPQSQWQADATSVVSGILSVYAAIGHKPPSKGIWKNIRMIRGGVEDKKDEDEIDQVEGKDEESTTPEATDESNDTPERGEDVATPTCTQDESKHTSSTIGNEEDGDVESKETNQGGVFASFFSLFRAPAVEPEDDSTKKVATNTSHIKHRIPHGPDGRGGGNSVYTKLPPQEEDIQDREEVDDEEFLITTEVATVSSSGKSASVDEIKPAVRKGGDTAAAFVVPPSPQKSMRAVDDKVKTADGKKSKKNSKTSKVVAEVENVKEVIDSSSNTTVNETSTVMALNESDSNATELHTASNVSVADGAPVTTRSEQQDYTSSGYWTGIDLVASLGFSSLNDDLKISRALRPVRKAAAKATGLHGFVSGKEYATEEESGDNANRMSTVISIDEELGIHDANALEAEMLARRVVNNQRRRARNARARQRNNGRPGRRWGFRRGQQLPPDIASDYVLVPTLDSSPDALEYRRHKRVEEIDRLLHRGNERLQELQCERDDLLQAPNPLFNYTKTDDPSTNQTFGDVRTTREFNFPSTELVDDYIEELMSSGRLITMNHTELWQSRPSNGVYDDDDDIGDDLLTPSADAKKLYENLDDPERGNKRNKSGGGSWLLRTGFGRNGGSIGEKLGETIEIAAYKGVCSAVMMVFAQMLSGLHGVNLLSHSDIRTYIEEDPDLPPIDKKHGPLLSGQDNYAEQAIKSAIHKGAKKKRKSSKHSSHHRSSSRNHGHELSEDAFIQRDAVVETLISYCQVSAPLLKLFPLDWQRAMVGNIVTLVTAIVSDFADGLQVQILGHALTVSFKPITQADMFHQMGVGGFRKNHRRTRPDEFEAAVLATAQDMAESLSFLDGWLEWLERRVGGGVLRSQIGNLIARVVLTLVDEVLSGARLDLWSSQANGPRLYAALEYRTSAKDEEEEEQLKNE